MYKNKLTSIAIAALCGLLTVGCYDEFDSDSYKPEFTISGYAAVSDIEPNAVVAYFPFDGSINNVVTNAESSNSGSTFINGFKGQAASFNVGSKTYVTAPAPASVTSMQSFTISLWVNPTFVDADANGSIDGILGLVGLSNSTAFWGNIEWFVENNSNNDAATVKMILNNGAQGTDIAITGYKNLFGNWSNHTITYDASTSKLTYYVNGSKLAEKTTPWTGPLAFTNSGSLVFGAVQFQTTPSLTNHGPEPWASWLTGGLDEVRIYNKALTATDINALVVLQGKGK